MVDDAFLLRAAQLAYLSLEPHEIEGLRDDCTQILSFLDELKQVDMSHVSPMIIPWPAKAPLRQDTPQPTAGAETITRNAPQKENNFFCIPKFIT
ncbi:Asp-tRNA(Asn)/Glu-tRNA(Gln) amidotransferase subunit GatC [Candidatus Hepatobacter penaei]|uniref:Asp-tRNA(Asn)/Glu-tRNA(Gln) amidotransferase subunit GatC n=1 Tax=Candidatus Hepatobacter penaei TaxID=1274402 RepID=UPI0004F35045|nr:Asp-tRNA(Asn)/Glu-tRNA(Gln) amidotransferase subunit GatC [Candidatus Hepatobacter penaei]